jgi:hypothetical protein
MQEGYVRWEDFERIQKMIVNNRLSSSEPSGAARRGSGLLAGMLRCRRCARMLRVYYKGPGGEVVRYACPRAQLDNKEARCIAFAGAPIDAGVAAQLLCVVRPAAIEAAMLATERQAHAHSEILDTLRRDLEAACYRAQRAERQYEATDPENRLVARELERRWNLALQEVTALESRIAEEDKCDQAARPGTFDEFADLASDLEALWNDPHADERTKKRLLRALIRSDSRTSRRTCRRDHAAEAGAPAVAGVTASPHQDTRAAAHRLPRLWRHAARAGRGRGRGARICSGSLRSDPTGAAETKLHLL